MRDDQNAMGGHGLLPSNQGGGIESKTETKQGLSNRVNILPAFKSPAFIWPAIEKPQVFPAAGRLPDNHMAITQNRASSWVSGREATCAKRLKICLFFDGTNNNRYADEIVSGAEEPDEQTIRSVAHQAQQTQLIAPYTYARTTNVARLFHACMGSDGAANYANRSDREMIENGWFKHYIQGVGTRFKEIGDLTPSSLGLEFGLYGESRINWGLTRICASLGTSGCFDLKPLELPEAQAMIKNMTTADGRQQQLDQFLNGLRCIGQAPKMHAIQLYVFGFSRGSAEARTFVNWLYDYLLTREENAPLRQYLQQQEEQKKAKQPAEQAPAAASNNRPALTLLGAPIEVTLLGIIETVATVGTAAVLPMMTGHMGWANGTMVLDKPAAGGLLKRIQHYIGGHEQRKCFGLDSVCLNNGYPACEVHEVVYPGVHSDVGGGYPPGEQYRANCGMGHSMSQIVLHEMYALAFKLGMPLQVLAQHPGLVKDMADYPGFKLKKYEIMDETTANEFDIQPELVERFNHWRDTVQLNNVNHCLQEQIHTLTAWRILRWVRDDIDGYANFLGISPDSHANGNKEDAAKTKARSKILKYKMEQANKVEKGKAPDTTDLPDQVWQDAGWEDKRDDETFFNGMLNKQYVPSSDGWDMLEAAKEFRANYLHQFYWGERGLGALLNVTLGQTVALLNNDDEAKEFNNIHNRGTAIYFDGAPAGDAAGSQDQSGTDTGTNIGTNPTANNLLANTSALKTERGGIDNLLTAASGGAATGLLTGAPTVGEGSGNNIDLPKDFWAQVKRTDRQKMTALLAEIRAKQSKLEQDQLLMGLFDEQLHDSRAWFMHEELASSEPFTGYFSYRLIYSGSTSNKPMSPVLMAGRIIGLVGMASGVYLSVKYKNPAYLILGLSNAAMFVGKAAQAAILAVTQSYERILIDPHTAQVLQTQDNTKALWQFSTNIAQALAAVDEDYQQPQSKEIIQPLPSTFHDTLKNLDDMRQLFAGKLKQIDIDYDQNEYLHTQQRLKTLASTKALVQQALDDSGAKAEALIPPDMFKVKPVAQPVPATNAGAEHLADGQQENLSNYIKRYLDRYLANSEVADLVPGSGMEALNQAQQEMLVSGLQMLGIKHEANEYLPAYLLEQHQADLAQLAKQFDDGQIPKEWQGWSTARLLVMRRLLAHYLGEEARI